MLILPDEIIRRANAKEYLEKPEKYEVGQVWYDPYYGFYYVLLYSRAVNDKIFTVTTEFDYDGELFQTSDDNETPDETEQFFKETKYLGRVKINIEVE